MAARKSGPKSGLVRERIKQRREIRQWQFLRSQVDHHRFASRRMTSWCSLMTLVATSFTVLDDALRTDTIRPSDVWVTTSDAKRPLTASRVTFVRGRTGMLYFERSDFLVMGYTGQARRRLGPAALLVSQNECPGALAPPNKAAGLFSRQPKRARMAFSSCTMRTVRGTR